MTAKQSLALETLGPVVVGLLRGSAKIPGGRALTPRYQV